MSDGVSFSVSLPLDDDGFLRRECPTCEREFKWLDSESEDELLDHVPPAGYFCPYCGVEAPPDAWMTRAQVEVIEAIAYRDIVSPEFEKLNRQAQGIGRASGGLIKASVEFDRPEDPPVLTEQNDMRRMSFLCHPDEPIKIIDSWERGVHCLICGKPVAV